MIMSKQIRAIFLNLALSLAVFTIIWLVLKLVVNIQSNLVLILSTIVATKLICPTISTLQTEKGEQIQLKSIFSKKIYIINNK